MPEDTNSQLREWLSRTLARLVPDFKAEISDGTSLTEGGLCLDSLALVDLIGDIEDQLGVQIREDEVSPEIFSTVGHLLAFLSRRPPTQDPSR